MENVERVLHLLRDGAPIAGAAAAAAAGAFAGGPVALAFGSAVGGVFGKVVEDVAGRALSARERARVGATASYAVEFVRDRLAAGDSPREDGFFVNRKLGASTADGILDGVLSKAKTDHEERKARIYGKFFSNVAFEIGCTRAEANYFLHLLDRLTYSQLVIIALFASPENFSLPSECYDGKRINFDLLQTMHSSFELIQVGLLKVWYKRGEKAEAILDMGAIRARDMGLSMSGSRLFELAGLNLISEQERVRMAEIFSSADCGDGTLMTGIADVLNA